MKSKFLCRTPSAFGVLLFSLFYIASADAKPKGDRFEPVSVKRRIEPNYPQRAYASGISRSFARVAFYVDERGNASDFLSVEYMHESFAEELLKVVGK